MLSAVPAKLVDPTFYPIEEKVGEDSLHCLIAELLRPLIEHYLAARGKPAFVGADQFIYWAQHRPSKVLAPDVYVLPGVPAGTRIPCLKVWEAGVVPSLAIEIVSPNSVDKDYRDAPERYAELGVQELVIFDPDYRLDRDRLRFQVFRLVRKRFTRVEATNGDRVRSRVLDCWLRAVGRGEGVRLRLASGKRGDVLVPTETERADKEHSKAKQEHARAQQEHARAEQERSRRENAELEVARLRAEIAKSAKRKPTL